MAKQPFRSIGMRVRDFARTHIRHYVSSGETVSRSALLPSWQDNAEEPLVWGEDAPGQPAPEAAEPYEAAPEDPSPYPMRTVSSDQVTPNMLQRLLEAHEERIAREEAEKAALMASQPPPVQRQADGDGTTPIPPRRRRGAVIDITPPHTATHTEHESPIGDESASDEGSPDDFFLNEATPPAVQRAPDVSPAPPTPTPRVTPTPRASNPATSFWRKLFSRGDESSPTQSEEDGAAVEADVAGADYAVFRADETPAFSQTDIAEAPTSVQRETEQPASQARQTASTETTVEPTFESEHTPVAPAAASIEDVPAFPDVTQTTPTTQTSAPSVQRKSETPRRSRTRVSQQQPNLPGPTPPPVQRELSASANADLPAQANVGASAESPVAPSSPAVQRAADSEAAKALASEPAPKLSASQPGRRARRSAGEANPSATSVQRKASAETSAPQHHVTPPQADSTPPEVEADYSPTVSEGHHATSVMPPSESVQRQIDNTPSTSQPAEPGRRRRQAQTTNPIPETPEAQHTFEPPTVQRKSIPPVEAQNTPSALPAVQRKSTPSVERPSVERHSASPDSASMVAHESTTPPPAVEPSGQPVVQRRSAVANEPAVGLPETGVELSRPEQPSQTTATNRPAPIPRIQRKARAESTSSVASVTGQAAPQTVSEASSIPEVQRQIEANTPEITEFANEPQSSTPVVQPPPQTKSRSTPSVQRARRNDVANATSAAVSPSQPAPVQRQVDATQADAPTSLTRAEPVQRRTADNWQDAPTNAPESSLSAPTTPQSASQTAHPSRPHIQRAVSEESGQEHITTTEPAAPRVRRKGRHAATHTDIPAPRTNAETPALQRQASVPQADEATSLTPTVSQSQAPVTGTPPHVQRAADQRTEQQTAFQPAPEDSDFAPDAPTMLTPVPSQTGAPRTVATVQRETAADAGTTTPEPRRASVPYVPPSPWMPFMQPPETAADVQPTAAPPRGSAALNASRGQTPAPIQRAPEATSPHVAAEAASDDLPPVEENEIDLFTAMMNTGMIQPPQTPAPAVSSGGTPPTISRRSAPDTGNRPTQPPPPSTSGQVGTESGLEQHIPDADSTDAELLTLLNLPKTTPVIRQAASESAVARFSEPAAHHEHSHETIPPGYIAPPMTDDMDDWGMIRRETGGSEAAPSEPGGEGGPAQPEVDVDKLARDVLDVLRQRLRVEQERRGGKM